MVVGLIARLKVSPQSMPTYWPAPSRTTRALCRSKVSSKHLLCIKIHMDQSKLT